MFGCTWTPSRRATRRTALVTARYVLGRPATVTNRATSAGAVARLARYFASASPPIRGSTTRTCSIGVQPGSEVPPIGCSCRDLAGLRRRGHRSRSDATRQRLAVYLGEPTATRVATSRKLTPHPLALGSLSPDIRNYAKRSPSSREITLGAQEKNSRIPST